MRFRNRIPGIAPDSPPRKADRPTHLPLRALPARNPPWTPTARVATRRSPPRAFPEFPRHVASRIPHSPRAASTAAPRSMQAFRRRLRRGLTPCFRCAIPPRPDVFLRVLLSALQPSTVPISSAHRPTSARSHLRKHADADSPFLRVRARSLRRYRIAALRAPTPRETQLAVTDRPTLRQSCPPAAIRARRALRRFLPPDKFAAIHASA